MARKPRADGTQFARETAADLARPLPEPMLPLSDRAEKYWLRVITSKRPEAWTDIDLDLAVGLCEDLALLEQLRAALQRQPALFKGDDGKIHKHPAFGMIEDLHRRILATNRALQINSAATNGRAEHQRGKNETARELSQVAATAERLFARPLRVA